MPKVKSKVGGKLGRPARTVTRSQSQTGPGQSDESRAGPSTITTASGPTTDASHSQDQTAIPDAPELVRLSTEEVPAGVSGEVDMTAWGNLFSQSPTTLPTQNFELPANIHCVEDDLTCHVPAETCSKIWRNKYINLATLIRKDFPDNSDQSRQLVLSESGELQTRPKPTKAIYNISQWTDAFIIFAAIYLKRHQDEVTDIFHYMATIREASSRSSSLAWRTYDEQFRMRREYTHLPWSRLHSDLWLRTMTPSPPNFTANLSTNQGHSNQLTIRTNTPNNRPSGICMDFNKPQGCFYRACKYSHICSNCHGDHSELICKNSNPIPNRYNFRPFRTRSRPYHRWSRGRGFRA